MTGYVALGLSRLRPSLLARNCDIISENVVSNEFLEEKA